ncbi:Tll0287-like domain-containing protein [Lutibacter maritimus]|uniref:Tll0287-like domain-containing protein n=1 Tax=Lutibacter maritimus TaxID=593133 RepID=A0A1I6Q696_9FLAO|nr:DUF3365 domain-containing protein [Lutibacter maritimus]SFS47962.1 Protein of unknown function [Lutibacter maritimus]
MIQRTFYLLSILLITISCNSSFSEKEKEEYRVKGKEIAEASFLALSTQLTEQMKAGGPAQAIPFCNQKAMPITNELSDKFKATIKRTSNNLRNPDNAPSKRESEILADFQKMKMDGKQLSPIVELDANNKKHFYAPIILKANCLVCHGKLNETVNIKTDSIIKSLYPNDKATGYAEGDLRGIWSITFKNK